MEQMEIAFYTKGNINKANSGNDVRLTLSRRPNMEQILLTFRNETGEMVAPETGNIGVGLKGTRLYFKEFPKNVGYAVGSNTHNKCNNRYCKITVKDKRDALRKFVEKNEGDYKLEYDNEAKMFYIETGIAFFTKEERT